MDKVFKVSKCMNNHNFRDIPNINLRENPDKLIPREGCHNEYWKTHIEEDKLGQQSFMDSTIPPLVK